MRRTRLGHASTSSPERTFEVAVFLTRDQTGEILLTHRVPSLGGYWHVVAGGVDLGESASEAASREVLEETGFDVRDSLRPCTPLGFSYFLEDGNRNTKVQVECFFASVPDDVAPSLNWEHDAFQWTDPRVAQNLVRWESIRTALSALSESTAH